MHWCMDETLALLALLPFMHVTVAKLRVWWHHRHTACAHPENHEKQENQARQDSHESH